jgi:sec-independent protein translocase protein TatA
MSRATCRPTPMQGGPPDAAGATGKRYVAAGGRRSVALQGSEWLIIFVIVIVLFGGAAIPKLARALGRAQGEFKKARGEMEREMKAGEGEALAPGASEEQVRRTARELGIDDKGKTLDEVKQAINAKLA